MKSFLLPLTSQTNVSLVAQYAAKLGIQCGATINALFIRNDPKTALPFMGEGLTADMIQTFTSSVKQEGVLSAENAHAQFVEAMHNEGISETDACRTPGKESYTWHVSVGEIEDHVGRKARTADVAICQQPETFGDNQKHIFHDLLYRSGRPVILVPNTYTADKLTKNILIAWNGRAEVARAVGTALPFLRTAETVNLLQVGEIGEERPSLENAAEYLADHGIQSKLIAKDISGPVGDTILETAKETNANMIVIGAYSHSRWREMIVGGATKLMISNTHTPIFMSH